LPLVLNWNEVVVSKLCSYKTLQSVVGARVRVLARAVGVLLLALLVHQTFAVWEGVEDDEVEVDLLGAVAIGGL
jgi:DNA-binding MltR family transcriptional regulator